MMRVMLKPAELSAIAFIRSSRGTRFGTIDWRTGMLNAQPTPLNSVKTKMCQTRRWPVTISVANTVAVNISMSCVFNISRLRSSRSAATPPKGPSTSSGSERKPFTAPSRNAEPVIW